MAFVDISVTWLVEQTSNKWIMLLVMFSPWQSISICSVHLWKMGLWARYKIYGWL